MFEKLTIVEVGDNLFHFRFDDETSLLKVFNGGPWNLPSSPSMMGAAIEAQSAVDSRMAGGERGKFVRVQVELPLDKPIKRGGHVTLGSGTKHWVDYKYERLNKFCYYCGSLLHE
ncbi:hypothetical protein Vadar_025007 [Vaccinium darrowii]|uniref:Uncharacterized protein n=1 Tax=Vaccinium darrowii TaxID=229202 RepID=A0ACB7YYE5_9ERIC|nr:hypothetical protein Vadar_025007 [Vaccinium darrowii]